MALRVGKVWMFGALVAVAVVVHVLVITVSFQQAARWLGGAAIGVLVAVVVVLHVVGYRRLVARRGRPRDEGAGQ